jgi:hypothetical protein
MTFQKRLSARRETERKNHSHKEALLRSVESRILPVLLKQGFVRVSQPSPVVADAKHADTFPFDLLRRQVHDGATDLVEIQFQSYGRAAFRINACTVPKEGMMTLGGLRTGDQISAGGLHTHFEMYQWPRLWKWFALSFWHFRNPDQASYDALASRVMTYPPEIDLALREDRVGPHMRHIKVPTNRVANRAETGE